MSLTLMQVGMILRKVSIAGTCIDVGWTWEVLKLQFTAGFLIRTTFRRPDRDPPHNVTTGYGRWWHVPEDVTESGIVKTAFAAAKLILEHELLEAFHYDGTRLFDPHHTVEDLKRAAEANPPIVGTLPEEPLPPARQEVQHLPLKGGDWQRSRGWEPEDWRKLLELYPSLNWRIIDLNTGRVLREFHPKSADEREAR